MTSFHAHDYMNMVSQRLIKDFEDASQATTPSLIGSAREVACRDNLNRVLPGGIGVGSGCVIDSYGNSSQQTDIVLYERDMCPVYSINNTPETTYYPCEGVIAVGEVKSRLTTKLLEDSFSKILSVKKLKRYVDFGTDNLTIGRRYGSFTGVYIEKSQYNPDIDGYKNIFGFILAGKTDLKPKTLLENYVHSAIKNGHILSPNMLITLSDGVIIPDNPPGVCSMYPRDPKNFQHLNHRNFTTLVHFLYMVYRSFTTVPLNAFDQYCFDANFDYSDQIKLSVTKN